MAGPILYFLLLVLEILLNLGPDIGHKYGGFSETWSEKSLEFISSKGAGSVALNLGLMLLLAEVDLVPEEQGHKGNTLEFCGTGHVKIVLTLSTKVVALYIRTTIV